MANEAERSREFVEAMVANQERMLGLLGIPVGRLPYLTGQWAVSPPKVPYVGYQLTEVAVDEARDHRYPHTCPRCNGPAYVGAVEVDCSRGCK